MSTFKLTLALLATVSTLALTEVWADSFVAPERLEWEHESFFGQGKTAAFVAQNKSPQFSPRPDGFKVGPFVFFNPDINDASDIPQKEEDSNLQVVDATIPAVSMDNFLAAPKGTYTKATQVSADEMTTLAETAFYAYEDKAGKSIEGLDVDHVELSKQGWTFYRFDGHFGFEANDERHSGFVLVKGDEIIITYRGSGSPDKMPDHWQANGNIAHIEGNFGSIMGDVHQGFYKSTSSSFGEIEKYLLEIFKQSGKSAQDFKYRFTGHSLGGAQAQIAAAHFKKFLGIEGTTGQVSVFTFGAPGWASEEAAKQFNAEIGEDNLLRFENPLDMVPYSTEGIFTKVGTRVEVNPNGVVLKAIGQAASDAVMNPLLVTSAQNAAAGSPVAVALVVGGEIVIAFLWNAGYELFKSPVKAHAMSDYVLYAKGSMEAFKNDPQQVKTWQRWKNSVRNFFKPVTDFFKPVTNVIVFGAQKVVKGFFYVVNGVNYAFDSAVDFAETKLGIKVKEKADALKQSTTNAIKAETAKATKTFFGKSKEYLKEKIKKFLAKKVTPIAA